MKSRHTSHRRPGLSTHKPVKGHQNLKHKPTVFFLPDWFHSWQDINLYTYVVPAGLTTEPLLQSTQLARVQLSLWVSNQGPIHNHQYTVCGRTDSVSMKCKIMMPDWFIFLLTLIPGVKKWHGFIQSWYRYILVKTFVQRAMGEKLGKSSAQMKCLDHFLATCYSWNVRRVLSGWKRGVSLQIDRLNGLDK